MKKTSCVSSAKAARILNSMLEYRDNKKEESMANKKTSKKKRLQEQKRKEAAQYGNVKRL